jgi:hypothetical protein
MKMVDQMMKITPMKALYQQLNTNVVAVKNQLQPTQARVEVVLVKDIVHPAKRESSSDNQNGLERWR